ncbi:MULTISPECIES: amidohydrolase/deacetylase family metallohydrolase [Niastella]|uniref:Amidohydrolase/deacetylase family metallohydrolase n=1 Tax=Niastella soli TaxID=2821487 RepID=A0ABS3YRY0_9BACT|nr:amidohydrolase/deacetylase family metallohydrolase [Niastella soli]MBO9200661.1 amidohydrolase/deacetylase family metallohydrolase [Niastella soli]
MIKPRIFLFLLTFAWHLSTAQNYALVIKGGHVIDAKNNINEVLDVAVNDGKIVRVAKNIDTTKATQVVNANGLYVTPGLIDAHVHVFYGTDADRAYSNGPLAVIPDAFTFKNGVTTVVDAGSSGWRNFPLFKKQVIDLSQTRVLAFINIVGEGMRGGVYEQDVKDMDGKLTGMTAKRFHDYVVGIKVAHYVGSEWTPIDEAVKAGTTANTPVMIDFGGSNPPLSIEELFVKHLRPGDIFTHCFGQLRDREPVVDVNTQKVKPFVLEARKKGIMFDVGYGSISFAFSQAMPAIKSGFYPNSISTDIHTNSMNAAMKDLLNVMSKLMSVGMDFQSVIQAVTWNPAQEIKHEELGHLSEGAIADIAILGIRTGKFGYFDYTGYKVTGTQKLECEMTIKGGKIVYDLDGIAAPIVTNKTGVGGH